MATVIVVNADDLGVSRGANLGIFKAHCQGIVTSASLATAYPAYTHALDGLASCPDLGIGLHFTLTSGKSVSDPEQIPLLIDRAGFFKWSFSSLAWAAGIRGRPDLLAQVDHELEAQLLRLEADGIHPDHINGERHVHLIPGIFERVLAAARRRGIAFIRKGSDIGWRLVRPRHLSTLVLSGGIPKHLILSSLARRARRIAADGRDDHFLSYLFTGRMDQVLETFLKHPHSARVVEIMVHPGIPAESHDPAIGNRELQRYLLDEGRRAELEACIRARELRGFVTLANFSQIALT